VIHIVTTDARTDTSSSHLRRKIMIEGFSTVEECESKMKAIRGMLKEAALEDHRSLKKRLLEKRGRRNEDEQEQQLIANMLELDPTQESSTFDPNKKKGVSLKLPRIESAQFKSFRKIGVGSFGDVFEVSWLGQKFAMKTGYETVTHETEISAGLSHPQIVRVFGVSTNKRHGCNLVMELMSEDLHKYIDMDHLRCDETRQFELDIAVDIMLQIAEGMQYLHDKQIVHRDLKSCNILVDPVDCSGKRYLRVKVADFGLAKIKAASATYSVQTKNVGTTRWMAPELLTSSDQRESSEPTPQELRYPFMVDVYSYAITCSEILTGDFPFYELQTLSDLRERVKDGLRPQLPASVPPCLVSLIQRCWDAEASKRPKFSEICVELRHLKASLMVGMYTISTPDFLIRCLKL
jgi:serine/threonine protein kinase